jgi:ABC-type tungstate transport system permease subunit
MSKNRIWMFLIGLGLLVAACQPAPASPAAPMNKDLILATTTSTQDSGLLDVLVPDFEQRSGYVVKTVAVGTGQALQMPTSCWCTRRPPKRRLWMAAMALTGAW